MTDCRHENTEEFEYLIRSFGAIGKTYPNLQQEALKRIHDKFVILTQEAELRKIESPDIDAEHQIAALALFDVLFPEKNHFIMIHDDELEVTFTRSNVEIPVTELETIRSVLGQSAPYQKRIDDLEEYICSLVYRVTDGRMSKGYDINAVASEVEDICQSLCDEAVEDYKSSSKDRWTTTPPTEQAWYWHWNGDHDCAPLPISVLYSGTSGKCFVSMGQLGIKHAIDCDQYGGFWMKLERPKTS